MDSESNYKVENLSLVFKIRLNMKTVIAPTNLLIMMTGTSTYFTKNNCSLVATSLLNTLPFVKNTKNFSKSEVRLHISEYIL